MESMPTINTIYACVMHNTTNGPWYNMIMPNVKIYSLNSYLNKIAETTTLKDFFTITTELFH